MKLQNEQENGDLQIFEYVILTCQVRICILGKEEIKKTILDEGIDPFVLYLPEVQKCT